MYIQLEQVDYDAIATRIEQYGNTKNGHFLYSEFEIEVEFTCNVESRIVGDYESDYSEYVVDDVDFSVKPLVCCGIEVKYNHEELEETIESYLWKET